MNPIPDSIELNTAESVIHLLAGSERLPSGRLGDAFASDVDLLYCHYEIERSE